jgi:hypothetical protein
VDQRWRFSRRAFPPPRLIDRYDPPLGTNECRKGEREGEGAPATQIRSWWETFTQVEESKCQETQQDV